MGSIFRRQDFDEFWKKWRPVITEREAMGSPTKLYTLFTSFLREKILEAQPDLDGRDDFGNRRSEHLLNSILHRIMPGYNQFVEIWLEHFDPILMEQGDVAPRARARERITEKRRQGDLLADLFVEPGDGSPPEI